MARDRLGFRLSEEQKERWKEHAEQSRYDDTMSDLVKRAVEEQINRDSGAAAGENPPRGEPSASEAPQEGKVLDRIQDLQNDLQDLQGDVSQAVDAIHAQEGIDPEIPPEIHSALPVGEENARTVSELVEAGSFAFSEAEAGFALENMARNMGDVKNTPEPPVGWYRVE